MEHRLAVCVPSGFASDATRPFEGSGVQLRWAHKAKPYLPTIVILHSCFVVFGAALSAALAAAIDVLLGPPLVDGACKDL